VIPRVAIIRNGGANIASLEFALERLGAVATVTVDAAVISNATHVILPGVGAARDAMRRLEHNGLADIIRRVEQPLLGICLGMQLLFESSAEGDSHCLGILPGRLERFAERDGYPVPHMGWNRLRIRSSSPLLTSIEDGSYAYFVHSYAVPPARVALATSDYGQTFSAVVGERNFLGTQFHPERSAGTGAKLLSNFLKLG